MKIPRRLFYGRILLAVVGGLVCALMYRANLLQPFDRTVYDFFNEANPLPAAQDVVIVAVDEPSLAELGRWPWPRENHVELLRRLRAADISAVAIDVLFVEPYHDDLQVDVLLADALSTFERSVLPVFIGAGGSAIGLREMKPIASLPDAVSALGHVHIEVDSDGVARKVYLRQGLGSARWPHFGVALAQTLGIDFDPLPGFSDPDVLQSAEPKAIVRSNEVLIPFIGPAGSVEQISYVDVMKGRVPAERLRGKIVFVGATAAGHVDNITTSLGQVPGVEVNVNIFQALRTGQVVEVVSITLVSVFASVLVAVLIFLFARLAPWQWFTSVIGLASVLLLTSFLLLKYCHLWVSPVAIVLSLLLSYPLWNWLRLASAMQVIRGQLARLDSENQREFVLGEPIDIARARGTDPIGNVLDQVERAQFQAQRNHALVRGTLEQLAAGVVLAELSGRILIANDELIDALGAVAPGDDIYRVLGLIDLNPPQSPAQLIGELSREQSTFSVEGYVPTTQTDVLLQGGVIDTEQSLLLIVLTDVSELKRSQKQRAEALNFLSHDLRAPLTSVLALIESARDGSGASVSPALLREIQTYIEANLSYAENFIQLAKLEQGAPPRFDDCDAQSLVDNSVAQLFHGAARQGVRFEIEASDEDVWLRCSRDLIERVLINLLDNAVKHSPQGGVVRLELGIEPLAGEQQQVIFSVCDEGPGIDEAIMGRLFEGFSQGEQARTGAGLGLRFVQAVAQSHGGWVRAANRSEGGACFTLALPVQHGA